MTKIDPRTRRSRLTLILLFLVCIGPFILAWLWFGFQGVFQMGDTTNTGELVHPAKPLEPVSMPVIAAREDIDEAIVPVERRWTVVYVAEDGCGADCREVLWSTRQIRLSLGRDMGRIQRVLLLPEAQADREYLRDEHDDLMALELDAPQAEAFLRQLELDDGVDPVSGGRLYIFDPLGNLMMYFLPGFDPDDFMDDMKRLLRVSQIG